MATSSINQRIVLTGADEVRRHLEEIAASGQRAGSQTRAALQAATGSLNSFTSSARSGATSSGQMRFALQNLSFQVNDVATSLASGGDVMRVFAQQGGQIFQVFQQGGGFSAVMRGAGAAIASFITPTTAAVAGLAALAGGFALLISRAASAEASARQFDVILKATGQSGRTTGKQLEAAAEKLHDVGLSANEAREAFKKFIGEGGIADQAPKVTRIGAELNKVLGEGSLEKFISAAAQGGAPLEDFAKKLGIVVSKADETSRQLDAARASANKFNAAINDAIGNQNKSIADAIKDKGRQLEDLARQQDRAKKAAAQGGVTAAQQAAQQEEDIATQSARRIQDINQQASDAINELLRRRNEENAAALAAYNQQIEASAQQAADKQSLIQQIGEKVLGSFQGSLSPLQQAVVNFSIAWNDLADTLSKSTFITQVISDFNEMIGSITEAVKWLDKLTDALGKVPGLPSWLGGGGAPIPGMAAGGMVHGPGTGTSDSIVRRLSAGEFVMPALSTKMYLPQLEAMRAMAMPAMPQFRMPRGMAMGGLVAAGGGGSPIYFTFPSGATVGPMMADRQVSGAMKREGRRAAMLSAGKLPSTA